MIPDEYFKVFPTRFLSDMFARLCICGTTTFASVFSLICQNTLNHKHCMQCESDLKQVFVLLRGAESYSTWQRVSLLLHNSGYSLVSSKEENVSVQPATVFKSNRVCFVPYVGNLSDLILTP